MKSKKQKAKPLLVAEFRAEALRLACSVSTHQRRYLRVGAIRGKELEPIGLLAGVRT